MRKPKYMEELLRIVFFSLGVGFLSMGLLCFAGIMTPSADSMVQTQNGLGIVFSAVGAAFFLAQVILHHIASEKENLRDELLTGGTRINGTVEKVYLQKYTQYGRISPYRVLYTYNCQGRVYHQKSELLWEKPDLAKGDPIVVYTDGLGKSAVRV